MNNNDSVVAVILAAGLGSRMLNQPVRKPFLKIKGIPILSYTLRKFENCSEVDRITLVIRNDDRDTCEELILQDHLSKVDAIVEGGYSRQESAFRGLLQLPINTEIVLIHDAVRMFVTEDIIVKSIKCARKYGACVPAVPVKDTMKEVMACVVDDGFPDDMYKELFVTRTPNREKLWVAQTPQTFRYDLILSAHTKASLMKLHGTDDAMLVEHFGSPVKIIYGSYKNFKITTQEDILIANAFLEMLDIEERQ